jgi:hypothetical protein
MKLINACNTVVRPVALEMGGKAAKRGGNGEQRKESLGSIATFPTSKAK